MITIKKYFKRAFVIVAILSTGVATAFLPPPNVVVDISDGTVEGSLQGDAQVFYGIPYGESTANTGRFMPPKAVNSWQGILNTMIPKAPCAQPAQDGSGAVASTNEDCLYVDVYAPNKQNVSDLPVMVWLPGGGFEFGGTIFTPGTELVKKNVILVVVSYRLGSLGFLAHPGLQTENGVQAPQGNLGLMDQNLALKWVQDNIESFGGNPDNVTLFGHSAGASSACLHQVSPQSEGLFDRLIMLSGACQTRLMNLPMSQGQGMAFSQALSCDQETDIQACLQTKSLEEIFSARPIPTDPPSGPPIFSWGPTVDGQFVPDQPMKLLAQGDFAKVPRIFGSVKNEGEFFSFVRGLTNMSEAQFYGMLSQMYPPQLYQEVIARYPLSEYETPVAAFSDIFSDQVFHCPMREEARLASAAGARAYRYFFTENNPAAFLSNLGVVHGAEQPYVFGLNVPPFNYNQDSAWLSAYTQQYFANFARYSNPNGFWMPWWPRFSENRGEVYLRLSQPIWYGYELRDEKCDFWASVGAPF